MAKTLAPSFFFINFYASAKEGGKSKQVSNSLLASPCFLFGDMVIRYTSFSWCLPSVFGFLFLQGCPSQKGQLRLRQQRLQQRLRLPCRGLGWRSTVLGSRRVWRTTRRLGYWYCVWEFEFLKGFLGFHIISVLICS